MVGDGKTRYAKVSPSGILVDAYSYSCKIALENQWYLKAIQTGEWLVPVCYQSKDYSKLYIYVEDDVIECNRVELYYYDPEEKLNFFEGLEGLKQLKREFTIRDNLTN